MEIFLGSMLLIVVLILIEIPVAFAFGIGAMLFTWATGNDVSFLIPHGFKTASSFALLALPLFIFAGLLMAEGGISERLLNFVNSLVGRVKGGLGALGLAKKARKSLEKALELDDTALQGSAYTSLGTLFHKVPGWPIAFGDDDDAEVLLKKGLENNPHGKISNFFYGEFLFDERKYHQAKKHLLVAKQVPMRVNSLLADKYRQAEIELLLAQVEKKIAKSTKR